MVKNCDKEKYLGLELKESGIRWKPIGKNLRKITLELKAEGMKYYSGSKCIRNPALKDRVLVYFRFTISGLAILTSFFWNEVFLLRIKTFGFQDVC